MTPLDAFLPLIRGRLPGCPEAILQDAARGACIEFCKRTELLVETVSVAVVADEPTVELTPDDGELWEVLKLRRGATALIPLNRDEFEAQNYDVSTGTPLYFYLASNRLLVLGPIPDTSETLTATVTIRPSDTCTLVDDVLWYDWREPLAAGARAWVRRNYGEWVNTQLELEDRSQFERGVHQANLRRRRGGAGTELHVRMRGFV